ncbi:MAG: hypothetical protein IT265_05720 [Saprospiraceae bacterium]|nr:hypothetical protein [Saprospiraceae bacterium]
MPKFDILTKFLFLALLLNFKELSSQDYSFINIQSEYNNKDYEYPKCTKPSGINIYRFDDEKIEFNWSGPSAIQNGVRYLVRYRYVDNNVARLWQEIWVNYGNSCVINNPEANFEIEIEIKKVCDGSEQNFSLSSEWVPVIKRKISNGNLREEITKAEECTWIKKTEAVRNVNGSYTVTITSIAPDSLDFWRYMIQYRECVADAPLKYEYFLNGDTTKTINVPPHGICEMAVRIIWGGSGENYLYWCQWDDVILDNNNNPPSVVCGQGSAANPSNNTPLTSANIGDIWTVAGIPVTLVTVSGSNGIFTGTGNLSIPFGKNPLLVTFSGIGVNTDKEVISGNVNGVTGTINCYKTAPTYGGPGQDICQPKANKEGWNSDGTWGVTGLTEDPYGFKYDGKFKTPPYEGYKEGDPYDDNFDPNGFDSQGNHRETGTKYGPNGCSRDGVDSLGNKCDPSGGNGPYSWMTGGGFTEAGKKYAEDLGDSLKIFILQVLDELLDQKTIEGTDQDGLCETIRGNFNSKITNLTYDPIIIKGANNEFYAKGMSKNFKFEPEKVVTDLSRRTGQKELEDLHVDLYKCDVKWVKIDEIIDLISDMKETTNLNELNASIKERIKLLPEDLIKTFKDDQDKFVEWLNGEIKKEINKEKPGTYAYHLNKLKGFNELDGQIPNLFMPNDIDNDFITSHTASNESYYSLPQDLEKEVNFQLKQGWDNILGRHKALWYEDDSELKQLSGAEVCDNESTTLPIIIRSTVLGKEEKIYIDNVSIGPNYGTCDVYYVLYVPTTGQKFVFAATNVQFGNAGLINDVKLSVLNDFEIRVNNSTLMRIFGGVNDTYVSFDCNGLKEISVSAELEFCRNYLIPVDPATKEIINDPNAKVKASFKIRAQGWGQMLIDSLSISSFCVKNAEDIKWSLSLATFDFSDQASPGFAFPPNYGGEFVNSSGGPTAGWRGIFIKNIEATLPKKFSKGNNPISVGAYNLIFDGMGFTGDVYAKNILSIDEGNIGGWAISIDSMTVGIVKNELLGGSMKGKINVPVFTENLNYFASIHTNNQYEFEVSLSDSLTADLWAAKVILLPNSGIRVENKDNEFNIAAKLNGLITVDGKLQGLGLKIPNVKFQDVIISNKDEYFSPGTWSTIGSAGFKFGTFELTADNIGLYKAAEGMVDLKLTVSLKITDIGSGQVGGKTRMYVRGKFENNNGRQKWVYEKIGLEGVEIDAEFSGNRVYGAIYFYSNDATFGSGFKGGVSADFKGLAAVTVFATFGDMPSSGNNPAYKYFFVDAMVKLDKPIPMGTLSLYGLGGGMYYHMVRSPVQGLQEFDYKGEERAPGSAPSGITYTPDYGLGFGFRATVALSTQVKEAFNCNITFEMAFYTGGGIQSISMDGNARIMEAMEFAQLPSKVPGNKPNAALVTANMHVAYDFGASIFDGSLEVFLNIGGVMKGVGPNDKMVDAKIYISKGEWYIHIGTPNSPCGIKYSVPGLGDLAQTKAYLCIGTNIPPMKPLSERGFAGFTATNLSIPNRASGAGFAFGSEIDLGFNEKKFLVFYGKLKILMGFDVMIGKFKNVLCVNDGAPEAIGINGWYAQGQAFAKIDANLGIRVKVFGKTKNYEILYLSAGVALAAKLPNPFYARGVLYGEYRILRGLVKGKCNFKFEIGEQCELESGNGEQDFDNAIITDIHPSDNSEALAVNSSAGADFFFPIDKDHFETDPDDPNLMQKFNAKIAYTKLIDSKGIEIPHRRILSADGQSVQCKPMYFLPSNDSITFEVKCSLYVDNTFDATEIKNIKFKTTDGPDKIDLGNIVGSYPFQNMKYFYQKEFYNGQGYISLEYGQPELFEGARDGDILVKFTSGGSSQKSSAIYNFGNNEILFNIPNLAGNSDYLLELIDYRKNLPEGKVLCSYSFHTSSFNTFKEKLVSWITNSSVTSNSTYDHFLKSNNSELFSDEEFQNNWVSITPNLIDNSWYTTKVHNQIYTKSYNCPGEQIFRGSIISPENSGCISLTPSTINWALPSKVFKDCTSLNSFFAGQQTNRQINPQEKKGCMLGFGSTEDLEQADDSTVSVYMFYQLPYKNLKTGLYKINLINKTVN